MAKKGCIPWNKNKHGIKTSDKGQISKRKLPRKIIYCKICKEEILCPINQTRKVCSRKCQFIYQKSEEYRNIQREKAYKRKRHPIVSSPEKFMEKILKANNIKYKKGHQIRGNPDFIIGKLCIFLDGEYWHNYPKLRNIDIENNKILQDRGYKIIRFWVEHDFYKDPTSCLNIIKQCTIE